MLLSPREEEEEAAYALEHNRLRDLLIGSSSNSSSKNEEAKDDEEATTTHPPTPRYVRLRPSTPDDEEATHRALLAVGGQPVAWCPLGQDKRSFYALPPDFRLAPWPPYQEGKVYGMDVASGVAVWALAPRPGERVLDLCCCPGLKLCMLADCMERRGTVTGT